MKIGVSAFAWTGAFESRHLRLIEDASQMGFSSFELPMFFPGDLNVKEIRTAVQAADIACSVCVILPAGINPISEDAATRHRSRLHLAECIDTAAELGAHLMCGPMFAPIGYLPAHRATIQEWEWSVEAFRSVGDKIRSANIALAIEPVNRSETSFLRTAAEAKRLCLAIDNPNVGVTIDTFHANIEEKSIAAAIEELGPYLMHVHASENDRGQLGSGHVDFEQVCKVLANAGYIGEVVIEGFGYSEEEPRSPGALWADRSLSPDALARNGLRYLRELSLKVAKS